MKTKSKMLIRCVKLLSEVSNKIIIIVILFTIIEGIIPTITLVVSKYTLNSVQKLDDKALIYAIVGVLVQILSVFLGKIFEYYMSKNVLLFDNMISIMVLEKSSKLSMKDYEDNNTYDIISRAQMQGGSGVIAYIETYIDILKEVITLSGTILIILTYNKFFFLIVFILPAFEFLMSVKLLKEQYDVIKKRTMDERKKWYIKYITTMGNAFKELEIFSLWKYFINKYKVISSKIILIDLKIEKKRGLQSGFFRTLEEAMTGIIGVYLVYQGLLRKVLIGDITTYTSAINSSIYGVSSIFSKLTLIEKNSLDVDFLFSFLDLPDRKEFEDVDEKKEIKNIESIEFRDVSFKYSEKNNYSVENISFKICKGESVCIVGRNGSGKSTIMKLILGLYDNYEGDILVNGINLEKINKKTYLQNVSCIFQDYMKYELTIKENVFLGDLHCMDEDEKILEYISYVNPGFRMANKIDLDKTVGKWFGETDLSEGEWQKLAISRFLFKQADLYIMDEFDSSLDKISERKIIDLFRSKMDGKISICITHKIENVRYLSDKILVMTNGKIVQDGKHSELIKEEDKIYFKLYSVFLGGSDRCE